MPRSRERAAENEAGLLLAGVCATSTVNVVAASGMAVKARAEVGLVAVVDLALSLRAAGKHAAPAGPPSVFDEPYSDRVPLSSRQSAPQLWPG